MPMLSQEHLSTPVRDVMRPGLITIAEQRRVVAPLDLLELMTRPS